ncbi:hypothetical protein KTD30_05875 [Burkholderia multivorans]|uniref:hypothetical protein n=1 Tax=Burkholderia multivorans TaxID=87883 RepID=UPI0011B1DB18|nr:hypothetical protein [Burkholderia multivorans]MBU9296686.1 hypothetical protein [Burkholderia multivorans]
MTTTISEQQQRPFRDGTWFPCTRPPAEPMWCEGRWPGNPCGFPVFWDGTRWRSKIFGADGDFWRADAMRAA